MKIAALTMLIAGLAYATTITVSTTPSGPSYNGPPLETLAYPDPSNIVPILDTNGVVVATGRLLAMQGSLQLVLVTNTASPQRSWPVQRAEFQSKGSASLFADDRAKSKRTAPSVEQTKTNLLGVISRSSGNAQRDAIVAYLEWLTLEVQALQEK